MAIKDKATCLLTASILPKDIRASLNGRNSFTHESDNYKWLYTDKTSTSSSAVVFTTSMTYLGTTTSLSITGDKVLWIAIKHTGTTNGVTKTSDGVVISIDAGTAAYNLADGTFINSGELFVGKFPNTTANQFTSTSVNVVGGLPTGAGNGDVQLQIAAIMQDVA